MGRPDDVLAAALKLLAPALGGAPIQPLGRDVATRRQRVEEAPMPPIVFPPKPLVPRPRLGLVMIVKDEAEVIGRCLDSVAGLIGWWTIVDTGSTDATTDIITEKLGHLPGVLYRRPWRDFGSNRSEAVALARGTADYLLLLDADHVVLTENFDPDALELDMYDIEVRGGISHRMPYLVQGDRPWYYRGKTHEHLACHERATRGTWDSLAVHHHGDGGTRHEKFTRDLALLEEALADDPDDVRTLFYLAQTRQSLGDHAGALAAFRRRMELGGWDEELYWSLYQCGVILAARGDWVYAQQAYLAAWEYRPTRAESLHKLVEGARQRGQWRTAVLMANQASIIEHPADRLFVESWVYRWGIDFELSISLWWVGEFERGLEVTERLLARPDLPEGHRRSAEANVAVYRRALEQ